MHRPHHRVTRGIITIASGGFSCDPGIGNVTTVIKRRSLNSIIIIPRFSTPLLLLRSPSLSLSLLAAFFIPWPAAIAIRVAA